MGEKGVVTIRVSKGVETMVLKHKLDAETVKTPVFGKPLWKYEEEEQKGLFEFLQGEMLDKDCHSERTVPGFYSAGAILNRGREI